jgi:hypothetical protein
MPIENVNTVFVGGINIAYRLIKLTLIYEKTINYYISSHHSLFC